MKVGTCQQKREKQKRENWNSPTVTEKPKSENFKFLAENRNFEERTEIEKQKRKSFGL